MTTEPLARLTTAQEMGAAFVATCSWAWSNLNRGRRPFCEFHSVFGRVSETAQNYASRLYRGKETAAPTPELHDALEAALLELWRWVKDSSHHHELRGYLEDEFPKVFQDLGLMGQTMEPSYYANF